MVYSTRPQTAPTVAESLSPIALDPICQLCINCKQTRRFDKLGDFLDARPTSY
jgi:hypothetical protein